MTNTCGTNSASELFERPCTGSSFVMAPNPANSTVTITALNSTSNATVSSSLTDDAVTPSPSPSTKSTMGNEPSQGNLTNIRLINIYSVSGALKKSLRYGTQVRQAVINTSDLANGIYFIEISDGTYSEQQKLVIQR